MRKLLFLLMLNVCSLSAQTIQYRFEGVADSFYLIERITQKVENSPRPQIIESPVFFRDTAQVEVFCVGMENQAADIEKKIAEMQAQVRLFRQKAVAIRQEKTRTFTAKKE